MTDTKRLPYLLELPMGAAVQIGDLPRLIAGAIHANEFAREAAIDGIWRELCALVDAGRLQPLNASTMAPHSFPVGDGLRRAVVLPFNLRSILEPMGIELRLIEPGNGPTYWSIANAASDIGEIEGWNKQQTKALTEQMLDAARAGALLVLNPQTELPLPLHKREGVRDFCELVNRIGVNAWLVSIGAPYRWVPYEAAAADPRYIAGRRLWKLSDAIDTVATIPEFGVSAQALKARVQRDAEQGKLTLRDPEDGAKLNSGHLSVFFNERLYAEDFNAWLEAAGYPERYRLRHDSVPAIADEPLSIGVRQTWLDLAGPYVASQLKVRQFATAKALFNALHDAAGSPDSPFDKGTGQHRGSLFLRELKKPLALKTVQNAWPKLRAEARMK